MKKLLSAILTIALAAIMAACGGSASENRQMLNDIMQAANEISDIIGDNSGSNGKHEYDNDDSYSDNESGDYYETDDNTGGGNSPKIDRNGKYSDKKNVSLYIHTYNCLPKNYITKNEAQKRGWVSQKCNLRDVCPGMSIGGDKFGNYEGRLPKQKKRQYYECDIDYNGGKRNAKRIVFSNDGLIYYTDDHYQSFTKLY